MDRSRMTKIKSKLTGAPFPINYEQDTNCRFFFSTLKRIFPTQLPTMSWFKLKLTYILIIFSLDFCLYYHYNLKLRLLLRTYVKFIFVNRNTWLLWNLFKVFEPSNWDAVFLKNFAKREDHDDQPMMLSNKNLNSENRTCSVVQPYSLTITAKQTR